MQFLSTPSARRATLIWEHWKDFMGISIHALREEGDGDPLQPVHRQRISIHALREEGDIPADGAELDYFDFYPRPPRGGRRYKTVAFNWVKQFLSTPSARRATRCGFPPVTYRAFLSTPSARRATMQITLTGYADLISIHALREEGDEFIDFILEALSNFYPRPPRGGRPTSSSSRLACSGFLSTPSARRATMFPEQPVRHEKISIHALREEGDYGCC